MENNTFTILDSEGKRKKLKNVLKSRTQGYLTEAELDRVMQSVKINRQYVIRLFFKPAEFRKTLTLPKMSKGEVVFGCARLGLKGRVGVLENDAYPVAIITMIRTRRLENQICIYIPENRVKKNKSKEQATVLCDGECVKEKWICEHIQYGKKNLYCDLVAN